MHKKITEDKLDTLGRRRRQSQKPKLEIPMPDGDPLVYRPHFLENTLGASDRTGKRMDFETVYICGRPYVRQNRSLQQIADLAKRKHEPPKRRRRA